MDRFDKIPYEDLSPESLWINIGKGSFGKVYKGEYLGLTVAIKEVLESGEYDVDKYFQRECKILQEARHPNIVQYLGLALAPTPTPTDGATPSTRKRILIISEFIPHGNLRTYIYQTEIPFPWRLRLSFAIDITRALYYLHQRQCIHRDLKGENLLVTENHRIKMTDFGFARIAARNEIERRRLTSCGTDGYMAPEIITGDEFGLEVDIFSLGVCFAEILSRQLVDGDTFNRIMPTFGIDPEEITNLASPGCPASFVALTLACVAVEPADRPVVKSILDSLKLIEAEVLETESRAPASERGTWNVGSIGYAGTTKKGGKARPSAPRLPSFNNSITLSSVHRGVLQVRNGDRVGSDDSDEADVAAIALAQISVTGSELDDKDFVDCSGSNYSTSVIRRGTSAINPTFSRLTSPYPSSTLTVRGNNENDAGDHHSRTPSATPSLPSLPPSWIQDHDKASSTIKRAYSPLPTDPTSIPAEAFPAALEPFLTARSNALSQHTATPTKDDSDDDDDDRSFHSISPSLLSGSSITLAAPLLHRFTLMRPGWRLLGVSGNQGNKKGSGLNGGKRSSFEEGAGLFTKPKCALCQKRLGILKAYVECDDCGFRCHLQCSDACPPHCDLPDDDPIISSLPSKSANSTQVPPVPTRNLPPLPQSLFSASRISASQSSSKLLKKRPQARKPSS